jgi:flagellin
MERLSKNVRINSSNNGAEGLSEPARLGAEVRGLAMAARNANDAISMLEIVEGATGEIVSMLQRMHELAAHVASDSYSLEDLMEVDTEFGELLIDIQWIAETTFWNTMAPLNGHDIRTPAATSATTQVGKDAYQLMAVSLNSWNPRDTIYAQPGNTKEGEDVARIMGVNEYKGSRALNLPNNSKLAAEGGGQGRIITAYGRAVFWLEGDEAAVGALNTLGGDQCADKRITITTRADGGYALTQLDEAIVAASEERAKYGACVSSLERAADNLTNGARHQVSSPSRVADANYAAETTEVSRTSIVAQAATAVSVQANVAKQSVLTLLQ